jgi:hypothetical protein
MGSVWQRLCALHLRGTWKPGSYNAVLLMAQIVVLWTAAQRGLDYVTAPGRGSGPGPRPSPALIGIEQDIPLEVLGLAFLIPAGVAFFGLATGWAKPLSLGHLFVGASYLVLGTTFLRDSPVDNWLSSTVGCALLVVAAALLATDSRAVPDLVAFLVGTAALVVGGWIASKGLGDGYRTGNGFLGAAALHFVFGFGTQVLARRDERLRREEEEDFQRLGIT